MNIVNIINTNNVTDIPKALRALADIVEKDIAIHGNRANSIGMFGNQDDPIGDFDYQIQTTNFTSLASLYDDWITK